MGDKDFDIEKLLAQVQNESLYELYDDYIYQTVMKIPLLNIWDMCAVAARDMFYNHTVPSCIKDFDKQALKKIKHTDKETIALLMPIQKWLSEQLIISINEKEVIPQLIGRTAEGKEGSRYFCERFFRASCSKNQQKITRPPMPSAAPIRPRHLVSTQQGVET